MDYTPEIATQVCEHIMQGLSLRKIAVIDGMPKPMNVIKWLQENPEFQIQYARAREEQADYYADEIIDIADNTTDPAKARVQVDSRKWIASKLKAKKYGDATQIKLADANGDKLSLGSILSAIDGQTSDLPGDKE